MFLSGHSNSGILPDKNSFACPFEKFLVLHVEPVDIRAYHGGIKDLPCGCIWKSRDCEKKV